MKKGSDIVRGAGLAALAVQRNDRVLEIGSGPRADGGCAGVRVAADADLSHFANRLERGGFEEIQTERRVHGGPEMAWTEARRAS